MHDKERITSKEGLVLPEGYKIDESDPTFACLIDPQGNLIGRYNLYTTEIIKDAIKHAFDSVKKEN